VANSEQVFILQQGVDAWNVWRKRNSQVKPDLRGFSCKGPCLTGTPPSAFSDEAPSIISLQNAELAEADLNGAVLSGANLVGADLSGAILRNADLSRADLTGAFLRGASLVGATLFQASLSGADLGVQWIRTDSGRPYLRWTDLTGTNLKETGLQGANLARANLMGANLSGAHLEGALLVGTNLKGADLTGCWVYGVSAWDLVLDGAIQSNLIITPQDDDVIQVDSLEVAQLIYLLLNNQRIRQVVETVTSKVVLILGRFTAGRKVVLNTIRDELRKRDYLPVLFDFGKPASQTTVETISTLAHMSRFVIADLTDARSVLQELQAFVPLSPSVVVQPLLLASQEEPGMFDLIRVYPWVLDIHRYPNQETLLAELQRNVIAPAEARRKELTRK
jgi:uncharacterized protein YjbI with pentapeptide repeats